MTKAEKRKPLPVDPEAVEKEANRRADLNASDPVQRGIKMAQSQALSNARGELSQRLADLQKCTLKRDYSTAGRDSYNRCHANMVKAAERLAETTGERFTVPAWLAPPSAIEQPTIVVGAPPSDGGRYKESKGLGPTGKGLPLKGPGSAVDPDWVTQ